VSVVFLSIYLTGFYLDTIWTFVEHRLVQWIVLILGSHLVAIPGAGFGATLLVPGDPLRALIQLRLAAGARTGGGVRQTGLPGARAQTQAETGLPATVAQPTTGHLWIRLLHCGSMPVASTATC
jgi:hypothetical protein